MPRSDSRQVSALHIRRKAKHNRVEILQVVGWRPSLPARPGGLLLADDGDPVGTATLSLPQDQRAALIRLLERYGRRHPTGTITIPADCVQAVVHYTSRTPAHGHLREAFVVSLEPVDSSQNANTHRQPKSII
jgi:hypothetical protein